jgi:hypothetical protein
MATGTSSERPDEQRGLRRFRLGAGFGLAGGVVGLVLPISLALLASYSSFGLVKFDASLIEFTAIFVLLGAILFAIALICYRLGFRALRAFDRWFALASILCLVGSVGLLLIALSTADALYYSPSIVQCIRGAPSSALSCLRSAQPLSAYSVAVGFWLAWLGGLGIVVGLALAGRRYRDGWLLGGGIGYALLLLVLIDPFAAQLFPVGGWQYPLLTLPVLALVAPALVFLGSRRAQARPSG